MTSYSVVSFDFSKIKKGSLINKDFVEDADYACWTARGIGLVPEYEEVDQQDRGVKFSAQIHTRMDMDGPPIMVRLLEDVYMAEVTTFGGSMAYVIETIGNDAFEDDYQEIFKRVVGILTGNAIRTTILTLWGFDSSGSGDYFDDYDEWHWFEGIITNEMLAGLAKQISSAVGTTDQKDG